MRKLILAAAIVSAPLGACRGWGPLGACRLGQRIR